MQLKGGHQSKDPRLDRIPQFDERSRAFPIRSLVPAKPRSYTWSVDVWLNQGNEGACVGFSWAHELAGRPARVAGIDNTFAHDRIYREAQKVDEWPGETYEGTSVLAGAKVVKGLGYISEYRWAFGLDDLRLAIGHAGPAVLGINWYDSMFSVDGDGFARVGGSVAGGHAILCFGVSQSEKFFRLHNSWGRDWGISGNCLVTFDDMDRLLHEAGEACVPIGRRLAGAA